MKLELTETWSLDQLLPYGPQITACLRKLHNMFPEDGTMESMAQDMFSGATQLWLMRDEDEFKGVVLTQIKTIDVTGYKSVIVAGLAGEDGVDLAPHISSIEAWAKEQGAKSVTPVGRQGWKKPLEKIGYHIDRVVYRKDIQ
jgi:hypothetical protein